MPTIKQHNLDEIFKHHAVKEGQSERYDAINEATKTFAKVVLETCSDSRERSVALTQIQDARMWANLSIALEHVID